MGAGAGARERDVRISSRLGILVRMRAGTRHSVAISTWLSWWSGSSTPYLERARSWPTHTLAVPTDLIVYTADEWQTLLDGGGRFAEVLSNETVWLIGPPD